jgi:sec-independent protein translocase protein TatA
MGEFSPFHWLVVLVIIVLLFGGRKIPEVMRGLGEGIKNFKEGMREGPGPGAQASTAPPVSSAPAPTVATPPPAPPAAEHK